MNRLSTKNRIIDKNSRAAMTSVMPGNSPDPNDGVMPVGPALSDRESAVPAEVGPQLGPDDERTC